MGERTSGRRTRITLSLVACAVLVATAPAAASGRAELTPGDPSGDAPAVADLDLPTEPVDVGVVAAPVRFSAGEGVALQVADGRRYLDTLELRLGGPGGSGSDDQTLVNELSIEDYVAGVAEMPGRWAAEALKAQAVAARTYAWFQAETGTFADRGYDICDTVACQAFAGASQEEGGSGARWRAAVDATAGEVLLEEDGTPILARYFSTSGGRTLPNEVVFPSSGPRPYLVGTDDPADEASPYHRWEVTFTRAEFETILSAGEQLGSVVPLASVERLDDIDIPDADLRFVGEDGTEVVLSSVDVRTFVSDVAPDRFPDRFPTARADGLRPLPTTIPSSRFTVDVGDDEVVVTGQGWGHGVGMGQYGARGRAEAGDAYDAILAAYYNGLTPTASDALPERIRVGLSQPAVGSVTADGPLTITADGETVVEDAGGTWQLAREGDGIRLTGPPGTGRPAEASRTEISSRVPGQPNQLAVDVASAVPGTTRLVITASDGEVVVDRPLGAGDAGVRSATWDLTDDDGAPVPDGTYDVLLEVAAADGSTAGAPLPVTVALPAGLVERLTQPADGDPGDGGTTRPLLGAVVLVAIAVVLAARRRRTPTRGVHPTTSHDDDRRPPARAGPNEDPRSSR